jgi:magnesium transporter
MSESKFYHISPAGKLAAVPSVTEALTTVKDGGFLWLDCYQPTRGELSALVDLLGLHPLSIEDCFDDDQVPKIEDYPKNTFILFNAFSYANGKLSIDEVDLFIGENYLVTVTRGDPDNGRVLKGIEQIVERDIESVRQGPAFLMHVILDHIVDQKFAAIELLEDELDRMEEMMLAAISSFSPAELIRLRRDIMALRKSIFHEREILTKICRKDCPFVSDKAIFHYRDIYDHLAKFFELAETYRDLVTSLTEMYLSLLNNQMTRAAQETNSTVRRLTFITTIFMPLTLLAGIGGMSEWSMMTGPENWRIAYPAFLAAMVLIGLANYYMLRRLEGRRRRQEQSPLG